MDREKFQELVIKKLEQLDTIITDMAGLKTNVADLRTDVVEIKSEMSEMNRRITSIQEQTASNTEFQAEVREQLERLTDSNEVMKEMLGEHEFAIRELTQRRRRKAKA